jgi:hypothetical protein
MTAIRGGRDNLACHNPVIALVVAVCGGAKSNMAVASTAPAILAISCAAT